MLHGDDDCVQFCTMMMYDDVWCIMFDVWSVLMMMYNDDDVWCCCMMMHDDDDDWMMYVV